jgi:hypothetical protein
MSIINLALVVSIYYSILRRLNIHIFHLLYMLLGGGTHAVAYLVEALCYKPEGRRFDSR